MRTMEFKMERQDLLAIGDTVRVSEGVLPSNYYYVIEPSLAMSGNYPFRDRLLQTKGNIENIVENEKGFYVTVSFEEE